MIRRQKPETKNYEKNIKFPVEPVKADYLYGLTKKQVQEREAAGWSNEEVGSVSLSTKDIVKKMKHSKIKGKKVNVEVAKKTKGKGKK